MERVKTGLEVFIGEPSVVSVGGSPALLCHQASVTGGLVHAIDVLMGAGIKLAAVFGPQHGLFGTDQANMVEWEGKTDSRTGIPVFSLYGKNRRPTPEMLLGVSSLIVDLQDVGARYYTYIWTALLCLRACAEAGIPMIVLDRPNPLGGKTVEGPGIEEDFESFVGLCDIPIRHGCTIGELMRIFAAREGLSKTLTVVSMEGWQREMFWPDTKLPWILPSPNMPTPNTALVYAGGCLLEGTNLSEGRGTTIPFELLGAPWIYPYSLAAALSAERLSGVMFRPCSFKPTFDKYANEICRGVQVHVTDRAAFRPVITYYAIIRAARAMFTKHFVWAETPYEYEYEKLPIDILAGSSHFREAVEADIPIDEFAKSWRENEENFRREREEYLLY